MLKNITSLMSLSLTANKPSPAVHHKLTLLCQFECCQSLWQAEAVLSNSSTQACLVGLKVLSERNASASVVLIEMVTSTKKRLQETGAKLLCPIRANIRRGVFINVNNKVKHIFANFL